MSYRWLFFFELVFAPTFASLALVAAAAKWQRALLPERDGWSYS
jgi:hypothetical protein